MKDCHGTRLQRLKKALTSSRALVILTHDFPDPDAISSAYGLVTLCRYWNVKKVTIAYSGFIGRAENRAMVDLLKIPLSETGHLRAAAFDGAVLVDSFPAHGNITLPRGIPLRAVIDHHPVHSSLRKQAFYDLRHNVGATSTMVTDYLFQAGCPISRKLATALFFGIKTDTHSLGHHAFDLDLKYYRLLFDQINHRTLYAIENPARPPDYFHQLDATIRTFTIYGQIGYAHVGTIYSPDFISEMADLFLSLQNLEWVACSGATRGSFFFSLRCRSSRKAGSVAERVANSLGGSGGGHPQAAAGRIPVRGHGKGCAVQFRKALLSVLHSPVQRGNVLIHHGK